MSNVIEFPAGQTSRRATQPGDSRLGFVSPYLDQPVRSFEHAMTDALQLRCRTVLMTMVRGALASARPA